MRTFLVLICTVALACAAGGAQNENQSKKSTTKKKQVQSSQHATAASRAKKATPTHYQAAKATHYQKTKGAQHVTTAGGRSTGIGANKTKDKPKGSQQIATQSGQPAGGKLQKTKGSQQAAVAGKYTASSTYSQKTKQLKGRTTSAAAFQSSSGIYKAKHFDLQDQDASGNGRSRNVSAKQTNCGKPKLAGSKLLGLPELQTCVAREELVEPPLQPRRVRVWRMVLLERRLVVPGLGLRSECILRL